MRLTLFLDHRCNLRCTYCYNGRHFRRTMPLEVARRAVDLGLDAAASGRLDLAFFGGEPLMHPALIEEVLAYARPEAERRGIALSLFVSTNGTLLDAARLHLLRTHRFRVQVSVDGAAASQDATRRYVNGRSSFAKVDAALRTLVAEGLAVRAVAVIDPANVRHLPDAAEHLVGTGVPHVYLAPNYLADWDDAACETFETALPQLGDRWLAWYRAGREIRLDPIHGKIVTHLLPGCNEEVVCAFGEQEVAVAPSGRLYPCDRLVGEDDDEGVCIGSVEGGVDVKRRARLLLARRAVDPECAGCELKTRCMRWCACANYQTTGDVGQTAPVVCWFERAFIAEADRVAAKLWEEQNPAFLRRFYLRGLQSRR